MVVPLLKYSSIRNASVLETFELSVTLRYIRNIRNIRISGALGAFQRTRKRIQETHKREGITVHAKEDQYSLISSGSESFHTEIKIIMIKGVASSKVTWGIPCIKQCERIDRESTVLLIPFWYVPRSP